MTLPLTFTELQIRGFRNLRALDLQLCSKVNVLSGDNGQGKTSVLEAIYFLATSRSFRTERLAELVLQGTADLKVSAKLSEAGIERGQRAVLHNGRRAFFTDDKRAERLGRYAIQTPVVVFHPGDLLLVQGPASARRVMLDRVALFTDPASGEQRARYQRAQKERQIVLERRGLGAPELDAFERVMAEEGVRLHRAHERAALDLSRALEPLFQAMAAPNLALRVTYQPGGCGSLDEFERSLFERRGADARRKAATFGPHKDDLGLELEGRAARHHASQGQQRILTLALKLAELECVRTARGVEPVLLLDDVSSELDPTRTGAVYQLVQRCSSQVVVTTTRPELFATPDLARSDRRDFRLRNGALESVL